MPPKSNVYIFTVVMSVPQFHNIFATPPAEDGETSGVGKSESLGSSGGGVKRAAVAPGTVVAVTRVDLGTFGLMGGRCGSIVGEGKNKVCMQPKESCS